MNKQTDSLLAEYGGEIGQGKTLICKDVQGFLGAGKEYKYKYDLLVSYINGVAAMTEQSNDMSAEQATDAILRYISQLDKE